MVNYKIVYTKYAKKDSVKIKKSNLKDKVIKLIKILEENPYKNPPPYEKLVGDLIGSYSRRINIQHRLVYEVVEEEKTVKILRMWTHYE